jgi:hypothetical protein
MKQTFTNVYTQHKPGAVRGVSEYHELAVLTFVV